MNAAKEVGSCMYWLACQQRSGSRYPSTSFGKLQINPEYRRRCSSRRMQCNGDWFRYSGCRRLNVLTPVAVPPLSLLQNQSELGRPSPLNNRSTSSIIGSEPCTSWSDPWALVGDGRFECCVFCRDSTVAGGIWSLVPLRKRLAVLG